MHKRHLVWTTNAPTRAAMRAMAAPAGAAAPESAAECPAHDTPLTGRDEAIFLLHIGAEIEHSLMVQYLYAAYSLDTNVEPPDLRAKVLAWQHAILDIAREEMGHLVTVQNLLRLLGGPLNFEREDFPWRGDFYPFHFRLEKLSKHSLAKYVVAEMPANPKVPEMEEIEREATNGAGGIEVNRVGLLYEKLIALFEDTVRLPDSDLQGETVRYQADFATWGRNYTRVPRPAHGANPHTPQLIVSPVANRTQALDALKAISEQGEGISDPADGELSHFQRFLQIYREFVKEERETVRPVVSNPVTNSDDGEKCLITHPTSLRWAQLFNTRYRMLLDLLSHALSVEGPSARGRLIVGAFAEMYHLRALSEIIMRQPMDDKPDALRCGPPFELPYTLSLPDLRGGRWRLHRDVLLSSREIVELLRNEPGVTDTNFLDTLEAEDGKFLSLIDEIIRSAAAL